MTSSPAWRAVLLVHLVAAFALPSAAHAAIASSDGSTIRVTSGPEALSVGIGESSNPGALYITQLTDVGIEPGAGCVAVRAGVECAYAGTPTVIVDLGEGTTRRSSRRRRRWRSTSAAGRATTGWTRGTA